jgi:tRNA threonylcarbamoyladenosine modification (KEOPS) complex  Pcc1 subunit
MIRALSQPANAEIRAQMGSPREAEIACRSLSVGERPGKSSASFSAEGDALVVSITAEDVGALRATVNSILREIKIAGDAFTIAS